MFRIFLLVSLSNCVIISAGLFDRTIDSTRMNPVFYGKLNDIYFDDGVSAELRFVTKLRNKREIKIHPYHIIELRIPSEGKTVSIHLTKNEDLVSHQLEVLQEEGGEEMEISDCFYRGIIVGHPGGTAALSACNEEHGLSGHILLGDEHLVLEPLASSPLGISKGGNTYRRNLSLHHRVYRAAAIMQKQNETHSDLRRVPKEEFQKAVAEFVNSTVKEENEEDEESKEENTTESNPKEEEGSEDSSETNLRNSVGEFSDYQPNYMETESYASIQKQNKKKSRKNKKKRKLGLVGRKVVEIAIFTDSNLFKIWEKRYPKDAKGKLKAFVLNLVNNMNLLYQQPSLGVEIIFRLVYLEVMSSQPSSLDTSDGDAEKYLKSFCRYAGDKNSKGENWDHALLVTGVDIKDGGDTLVAGLAWFSTMCLKYWSCSISEGFSFSTTYVLAHEIGHSLGMDHDGSGPSTLCSSSKYLMSPTTGSGKSTWSTCSSKNVKDFITKGTSDLGKEEMTSVPVCLGIASPLKKKSIKFLNAGGKLPGELFKANVQCQYDLGTQYAQDTSKAEEFCKMLVCSKSGSSSYKTAHPALEGTSCGNRKQCRYGKCVNKISTKSG